MLAGVVKLWWTGVCRYIHQYNFPKGADKLPTSLYIDKPQLKQIFYTDWDFNFNVKVDDITQLVYRLTDNYFVN